MSMPINIESYLTLIKGDLEWLLKNTERDLERDHIIAIIKESIKHNYPKETPDENFIKWWEENIGIWELMKLPILDTSNIGFCIGNKLLDVEDFDIIEPSDFVLAHMTPEEILK